MGLRKIVTGNVTLVVRLNRITAYYFRDKIKISEKIGEGDFSEK